VQHDVGAGHLIPYAAGQITGSLGDMRIGDQQKPHAPNLAHVVLRHASGKCLDPPVPVRYRPTMVAQPETHYVKGPEGNIVSGQRCWASQRALRSA
jgi:hypothetical protein